MMGIQPPPGTHDKADGRGSMMTELDSERKPAKVFRPIVSLQRVWKTYVKGKDELVSSDSLSGVSLDGDNTLGSIPSILFTPADRGSQRIESEDCVQSESSTKVTSRGIHTRQNVPELDNYCLPVSAHCGVDSETESIVSDYSEMADPVKEHLANVQIVCCPDLDPTSPTQFIVREKVLRGIGEGEDEFVRRLRKTNFLSLAQEFAELKKQKENALPFNLHEERYRQRLESESETDEIEEISVDSHSTADASVSRDEPEGGYDSGWQDETLLQPETDFNNGDFVAATSKCNYNYSTPVKPCGSLSLTVMEGASFDEVCRAGAEETHSGNVDLSSLDGTGTSTQPFVTENIPDIVPDQLSVSPSVTSKSISDFSALCATEPVTTYNQRNCCARSNVVDSLQELEIVEDLDDFTIEKTFPQWDWERLEDELVRASEMEHDERLQPGISGDRDEILRRLAMLDEEDWYGGGERELNRVPGANGLDVCYVNEAADDPCDPDNWDALESSRPDVVPFNHNCEEADLLSNHCSGDDLLAKQATFEAEAKLALAQVRSMVQLQLKPENQLLEESSVVEMVGALSSGEKILGRMSRQTLERMTVAQLQIFANDFHARIEVLNRDLMLGLMERDDLHMVQDSMLVDIEDLTGRAREYTVKVDGRRQEKRSTQKCT